MPLPSTSPSQPLTENPVFLRAPAALEAAGAYDTPVEVSVAGFTFITLFFQYIQGAAAQLPGAFTFIIESSPFAIDPGIFTEWYRSALYEGGNLAAGVDTASNIQREDITYQATGAVVETFTYGPIGIEGNIERIRISVCESGDVAEPGTLGLIATLYSLG